MAFSPDRKRLGILSEPLGPPERGRATPRRGTTMAVATPVRLRHAPQRTGTVICLALLAPAAVAYSQGPSTPQPTAPSTPQPARPSTPPAPSATAPSSSPPTLPPALPSAGPVSPPGSPTPAAERALDGPPAGSASARDSSPGLPPTGSRPIPGGLFDPGASGPGIGNVGRERFLGG